MEPECLGFNLISTIYQLMSVGSLGLSFINEKTEAQLDNYIESTDLQCFGEGKMRSCE